MSETLISVFLFVTVNFLIGLSSAKRTTPNFVPMRVVDVIHSYG
jgi:hypothetical protein